MASNLKKMNPTVPQFCVTCKRPVKGSLSNMVCTCDGHIGYICRRKGCHEWVSLAVLLLQMSNPDYWKGL